MWHSKVFLTYCFLSCSFGVLAGLCVRVLVGLVRVTRGRISLGASAALRCSLSAFVTLLAKQHPTPNSGTPQRKTRAFFISATLLVKKAGSRSLWKETLRSITMTMTMSNLPVTSLKGQKLMSQPEWQGIGPHTLVSEKLASQFEVLCCDPAQANAILNEVVVFLLGTTFQSRIVSRW